MSVSPLDASQPQGHVFIKHAGTNALPSEAFAKLAVHAGDTVADLAERACAKFPRWRADAGQTRLCLVAHAPEADEPPSAEEEARAVELTRPHWALSRAGVVSGSWLLAHVAVPAAPAPAPAASLEDLLVAGGMRRADVRKQVIRRAYVRYGGAVAGLLADAGRAEAAVAAADVYAMAASLPSLTTEADLSLVGLHVNGLLYEGGALVRCFRGCDEFVLKPLDAREKGRALALHEALATARTPITGLSAFELHPRGEKLFMLMPRHGASLEHLAALGTEDALVLWRSVGGALRGLHALGFAHMDVKPANICTAGAQGFVLVDFGSVARFGEATSTTMPYVAADFPGAMRRSSAHADWWQLAMTLAEKACGERCLDVGACVAPTMAALAARLRENLPAALWQELEPTLLLEGGAA